MLQFTFTPIAAQHMRNRNLTDFDLLGYIPDFLDADDPADAVAQIDKNYRFGGWRDREGMALSLGQATLTYPGDRPRELIAEARLRDERILFFNGAWIVVVQPDGSFRTSCID